ncbi:MAG: flagellar basal-body rod protein FlgG [Syntrophomonas sp.]|nr:flagellar basal-body rod protein FlgG [Syntrophomonas sp.]
MMRSLYTASTGMYAQQLNVDTIAHNMSNVNTAGYKKERVEFQDLLYQMIKRPAATETANEPVGLSVGLGVKPVAINTLFGQGNLQQTENTLDVAISGQAFFKIKLPNEEIQYSRDGSFKLDGLGQMVTSDGNLVVGAEPITAEDATDINIDADGTVTYMSPSESATEAQPAGKIELAKFVNPAGLEKVGSNLYKATPNSGEPTEWDPTTDTSVSLQSGYLEMANVKVVEEMVSLITAQRAYDINSKVIQASDEMLQTATGLRR